MIARILNIWRPSYFEKDTDADVMEMILWSTNIQDPDHPLYNPFLLTQ